MEVQEAAVVAAEHRLLLKVLLRRGDTHRAIAGKTPRRERPGLELKPGEEINPARPRLIASGETASRYRVGQ